MEIYIIGCGGNSKVIVDICELNNYKILGLFDDKYQGVPFATYKKYPLVGKIIDIQQFSNINIINSIGDNHIRETINEKLKNVKLNWVNCIHKDSYISSEVELGYGNVICFGSVINSDTKIGNFNLINTCAVIEHDCQVGNYNHFAPRSTICGGIIIGNLNLFGASCTIIPNKVIGSNNKIGASCAIINNYTDNNTIVGVPDRIIKLSF